MRCLTLALGVLAASINRVHGSGDTALNWLLVTQNQSALFGYQLVGSTFFNDTQVCNNISIASHGLWTGTMGTYIQRSFCDQIGWDNPNSSSSYDYDIIQQNIKFFNTGTFLTQLLSSFDSSRFPNITMSPNITVSTNPYTHLCAYLLPSYLEAFNIDSDRVRAALCGASNLTQTPPAPLAASPLNETIIYNQRKWASILFSYVLISTSTTTPEADALCLLSQDKEPGVENTGLGGSTVYNVVCGRDGRRMSENEHGRAMRTWTTKVSLNVLENASGEAGWMAWLCGNLDAVAMNVVAMDGFAVMEEVCGGERVGESWCYDPWLC